MRKSIVEKLNKIEDVPTFYFNREEIEWIVKNWVEGHVQNKVETVNMIGDTAVVGVRIQSPVDG